MSFFTALMIGITLALYDSLGIAYALLFLVGCAAGDLTGAWFYGEERKRTRSRGGAK